MASLIQLCSSGEARRARTYNSHMFAGSNFRWNARLQIYPFSNAVSAIVFSMYFDRNRLVVDTQERNWLRRAPGQILPVNSGKLFVLLRMLIATSHFSL
jgi:hypothetical protein